MPLFWNSEEVYLAKGQGFGVRCSLATDLIDQIRKIQISMLKMPGRHWKKMVPKIKKIKPFSVAA